ncbi:MAG TPA: metal-dependent hydrolase [Candidatus Bathyarchaeia archaeon]|nr:metal-dependent hydrolase [Candidatus Bathyarchaeia archaeon]
MKALTHSIFAFVFCIVVSEIALSPTATSKLFLLLSATVSLLLGSLPDLDAHLPLRLIGHRSGFSHSIFTAAACTGLSYVLLSPYMPLDLIIVPAVTAAIVSHILLDSLTVSGCPLLWPLSRHRFSAHLCKYDSLLANTSIILFSCAAVVVFVLYG